MELTFEFDWNSAQETEKRLSGENIARGLANAWERPCVTSQTTRLPNNANISKQPSEKTEKSEGKKKTYKISKKKLV